jgi:hypothetical protein
LYRIAFHCICVVFFFLQSFSHDSFQGNSAEDVALNLEFAHGVVLLRLARLSQEADSTVYLSTFTESMESHYEKMFAEIGMCEMKLEGFDEQTKNVMSTS